MKDINHNKFENITPEKIIEFSNSKPSGYYKKIRPEEIFKSQSGEIFILKGNKKKFESLINFWLSVQSWYSDGSDNIGDHLCFDDLTAYDLWHNNKNRLGLCKLSNEEENNLYHQRISFCFKSFIPKEYLIMDSNWNNLKIIFTDNISYYVYYFWTGN